MSRHEHRSHAGSGKLGPRFVFAEIPLAYSEIPLARPEILWLTPRSR